MTTVTSTARISLESGSVPLTRTGHSISVRARKTNAAHTAALGIHLYEGAAQRTSAELTQLLTSTLADYTLAISDADAATITSYAELELRIRGFSTTDDLATFQVARITLNLPIAGGFSAPSAPLSLLAQSGSSQVSLTWSAPASNGGSAVLSYKIYRGLTTGSETLLATPIGTTTNYVDATAANGTAYFYKVSAVNAVGEGALSNESSATAVAAGVTRTLKRLYGPALLGNSAATLYTCPASTTAVIRHIHVSNPSASPVDLTLSIGAASVGARLWDAQPVAARNIIDHLSEHVLAENEIVQGFAGSAATLNVTLDGYELTSAPAPPVVDTQAPTVPTNLQATATSATQINLSWTASTDDVGVTGYRVERCQGASCSNFAEISQPSGTTYSNTGLTPSTSYSYRVRAFDAVGNLSAYSTTATVTTPAAGDTQPPTAPTNLNATAVSSTQINLSWTAATDNVGVTGYRVERCSGAGCSNFVEVAQPSGTTYSDTGLTPSTSYSYRIRAADAAGNIGPVSGTASATTPAAPVYPADNLFPHE